MVFFLLDVSRLADVFPATIFTAAGERINEEIRKIPGTVSIEAKCREFLRRRLNVIGTICDTSDGPARERNWIMAHNLNSPMRATVYCAIQALDIRDCIRTIEIFESELASTMCPVRTAQLTSNSRISSRNSFFCSRIKFQFQNKRECIEKFFQNFESTILLKLNKVANRKFGD